MKGGGVPMGSAGFGGVNPHVTVPAERPVPWAIV